MEQIVSLKTVYEELKKIEQSMVTKEEMNSFLETMAVVSNDDTMEQIRKSEEDIANGNFKEINSVADI